MILCVKMTCANRRPCTNTSMFSCFHCDSVARWISLSSTCVKCTCSVTTVAVIVTMPRSSLASAASTSVTLTPKSSSTQPRVRIIITRKSMYVCYCGC